MAQEVIVAQARCAASASGFIAGLGMALVALKGLPFMFNQLPIIAGFLDRVGAPMVVFVVVIVFLLLSPRSKRQRCRRCHEVNRPHARYCAQCGAAFHQS